jgi:D-glycero-D-manno-heptose 1,7-bisphosphate phosphatase
MAHGTALIILDRDGVLNQTLHNPNEERPDSPLCAADVVVFPWVPALLRSLTDAGYALAIASNQPAFAKGKTSLEALRQVQQRVLAEVQSAGAVISSSHLCFHRKEDGCACRKPQPGLLLEALAQQPDLDRKACWMVGDRATDVLAGVAAGVQTALLGDTSGQERLSLATNAVQPVFCGSDLRDFCRFVLEDALTESRVLH